MTVERRALSGSLVTALGVVVQFGHAIVLVPLFLARWGQDRYGMWLALVATFQLVVTLDAGHQTYVGNELARLYPVDVAAVRRALASAFWLAMLLGAVELLLGVGLWLGGALPTLMGNSRQAIEEHELGLALVALLTVWFAVSSVGGVVVRVLPPAGRYTRSAAWGLAYQVLLLVVWAGGVAAGVSILSLVLLQVGAQFLFAMALFRDLRTVCDEVYPFWSPFDAKLGMRNLVRSVVLTGTNFLTQLQQNGLNLLVSSVFGAAMLPVLTTARTLANVFMQGTNVVAAPLAPDIVRYHVKRERDKLHGAFAGIWFVGGGAINLALAASLLVVEPFYTVWTRGRIALDWPLYLPLMAAVSMKAFAVPLFTYLSGLNHLRGLGTLAGLQAFIVIGGAWLLTGTLGLPGASIAILVAEAAGCFILVVFGRSLLASEGMTFPWRQLGAAALSPVVSGGLIFSTWLDGRVSFGVTGIAIAMQLVAIAIQWRLLPAQVKRRMVGLVRKAKPVDPVPPGPTAH